VTLVNQAMTLFSNQDPQRVLNLLKPTQG